MANITAQMVKELRERTGAGILDCKKALQETDGDMDKAVELLRKKGLAAAAKKAGRIAAEGLVHAYIHGGDGINGRIGVLVEVNCETDFAANTTEFKEFVHKVALQIAANSPQYLTREDIPEDVIAKEREIRMAKLREEGKPDNIVEKIVEGQLNKWFAEICLMEMPYIFSDDGKTTIEDMAKEVTAKIGEKVSVRRFVRYELGEGLEKRSDDLAAEVAKEIAKAGKKE